MKKVGFIMVIIGFVMCSGSVHGQQTQERSKVFSANFQQLAKYLKLTPVQIEEVYLVNKIFIDEQERYLSGSTSPVIEGEGFRQILFGNFKQMKNALTEEQYGKYVALINLTHYNRLIFSSPEISDVYLALTPGEDRN